MENTTKKIPSNEETRLIRQKYKGKYSRNITHVNLKKDYYVDNNTKLLSEI